MYHYVRFKNMFFYQYGHLIQVDTQPEFYEFLHEFVSLVDLTKSHENNSVENFMLKYGYIVYGDDGKDDANMTQFYSYTGHQIDKMLLRCTWRRKPCSAANFTTTFTDAGKKEESIRSEIVL